MKKSLAILFSFLAIIAIAKDVPVVPIDQEPDHHLILENEFVRVFDVTVPAGASTLMHRHDRDYIFITLGDAQIRNERMNEKPAELSLKDGEARYVPGGFAHIAVDIAKTPFHNVTIELKNPGKAICGIGTTPACENGDKTGMIQTIFSTEHMDVSVTTLDPGQQTPVHTHKYPHLAVALDDLSFENQITGSELKTLFRKKGEVAWIADTGFTHFLKNPGKQRGRLVALEFK